MGVGVVVADREVLEVIEQLPSQVIDRTLGSGKHQADLQVTCANSGQIDAQEGQDPFEQSGKPRGNRDLLHRL